MYHIPSLCQLVGLPDISTVSPCQSSNAAGKESIIYARVSSAHQKEAGDLQRQIDDMQQAYPSHTVIADVGSGLNFQRKGLQTLLERVHQGMVEEVVVRHKDRLCRYGLELVEWVMEKASTRLVVLCAPDCKQDNSARELADDLLAITTVFVARHNGRRSAENRRRRKQAQRAKQTRSRTPITTSRSQPAKKARRVQYVPDAQGPSVPDSKPAGSSKTMDWDSQVDIQPSRDQATNEGMQA